MERPGRVRGLQVSSLGKGVSPDPVAMGQLETLTI